MTTAIITILDALDATGATESTGPIRSAFSDFEMRITDLEMERASLQQTIAEYAPNYTIAIDEATAPLRTQITVLQQNAIDLTTTHALEVATLQAAIAEQTPTIAARDAEILRLNALVSAIDALLHPPLPT